MLGPYEGLMKSAGGMQQAGGMQATPVHHVGKGSVNQPQTGSTKDDAIGFLGEVEGEMQKFRPGSASHNKLSAMRGQILMDIADMDIEHQNLPTESLQGLTTRMQDLKAKMLPYQRGITPEGKPVR